MTKSEDIFECIMNNNQVDFEKIPESISKTPDYETTVSSDVIYWEIKEIKENQEENEILEKTKKHIDFVYSVNSKRVEYSIKKAARQLKEHSEKSKPCIVALFDVRDFAVQDFVLPVCPSCNVRFCGSNGRR